MQVLEKGLSTEKRPFLMSEQNTISLGSDLNSVEISYLEDRKLCKANWTFSMRDSHQINGLKTMLMFHSIYFQVFTNEKKSCKESYRMLKSTQKDIKRHNATYGSS
jgi:hypothetical protein